MGCGHPSKFAALHKDAPSDETPQSGVKQRPHFPGRAKLQRLSGTQVAERPGGAAQAAVPRPEGATDAAELSLHPVRRRDKTNCFEGSSSTHARPDGGPMFCMTPGPDPLIVAGLYVACLCFFWVFAMDIQNASRALWNACGTLKDRMRQPHLPRTSSEPSLAYAEGHQGATRPGTPEGHDAWSLVGSSSPGRGEELMSSDAGHFTEEEFLRRFGGGAQEPECEPEHLPDELEATVVPPGPHLPLLSEPSALLEDRDCAALAAAVPIRHRWRRWHLLYGTGRDGISLQTLYRQGSRFGPTILVVRDRGNQIFGCFCAEPWKVSTRYYGTGESFVFQLKPELRLWRWYQKRMALGRNDFFQYSTPECLAMGGAPAYALKLDGDLVFGRSGNSETFGNAPLASTEEFEIGRVELWGLA